MIPQKSAFLEKRIFVVITHKIYVDKLAKMHKVHLILQKIEKSS